MTVDTRVIIIGAGPAGLSAAKVLAIENVDYLLLAKEKEPCKEKVCGGFMPARAIEAFDLGKIKGACEISTVRMKFPGMDMVRVDFERLIGINATRGEIGKSMLKTIPRYKDNLRMETTVETVKETKENIEISVSNMDERNKLTADMLIDASGANSVCIRNHLVRDRILNEKMGYAVQYHVKLDTEESVIDTANDFYYGSEYSPGGYAWIFPRKRDAVVGTGGIIAQIKSSERRVAEYLEHFIRVVGPVRTNLEDSTIVKREAAIMPLAGTVKPSFSNRILLAGDAAGHCSPISGEGIYYSMVGGAIAGHAAVDIIDRKRVSKKSLSIYEKRWIKAIGSDLKWGAWVQKRFTRGGSSNLISTFLDSEKNQRIIAEMLVGEQSVRGAILKAAPGYLKSKVGL